MKKIVLTLMILALTIPFVSFAHSGRTDSSGCHTCRTNCPNWGLDYGEYHCHRSKGVVQPLEPVRSIRNESGVGQTVSAPEYKVPTSTIDKPKINVTPKTNTITPVPSQKVQSLGITEREQIEIVTPQTGTTTKPVEKSTQIEKKSWISRFFSWLF